MSASSTIFGLVLAGGQSSRMGHDKGLIEFYGKPQREYVFDMLRNVCDDVFLSCKQDHDVPTKLNPLPDRFDLAGPLNGILTAFHQNSHCAWLTVPVDMPLIDQSVLEYLLQHRDTSGMATCFFDSDGVNPEPLVAVWEPHAYPLLEKGVMEGQDSPRKFLKQHRVHIIPAPDTRVFININSPAELERFNREHRL